MTDKGTQSTDESAAKQEMTVADISGRVDELVAQHRALQETLAEITGRNAIPGVETAGRQETDEGTLLFDGADETYKILGQFAESNSGVGVLGCNTASSGATSGVKGEVDSEDNSAAGVRGIANSDADGAAADGVVGKTNGTGSQGAVTSELTTGVRGEATNASGVVSYGVYGSNASTSDGTAGVFGIAFGGSGTNYGLRGETTSDDTGAAGVSGETTSSSGTIYGVSGKTSSGTDGAAGVYGANDATDGVGVLGEANGSGATHGVEGVANSSDGFGLYTSDDAKVNNVLVSDLIDTENEEFNVNTASVGDGAPSSIVMGQGKNTGSFANGGVIAGGGYDDGTTDDSHNLLGDYGTVSGGRNNNIDSEYGTISGGRDNKIGDTSNNNFPSYVTIGGGKGNTITADDASYAAVGGGHKNEVKELYGTIAGGGPSNPNEPEKTKNVVIDSYGAIGGGGNNRAGDPDDQVFARHATVAGGENNHAKDSHSAIGGGEGNTASGSHATVAGGHNNTASGSWATVPGGQDNVADGKYSLAAGHRATAQGNKGTFVWGDSSNVDATPTGADQFHVQASGGVALYSNADESAGVQLAPGNSSWSGVSSRDAKTDIDPVDPPEVLRKVEQLEVSRWEYDTECDAEHMGPMAEDFHDAFGLGIDREHIDTVDADGVALAAIQGLSTELDEARSEIEDLEAHNEQLEERVAALEAQVETRSPPADD